MKVPIWEASPGALAALLNATRGPGATGSFTKAQLYTINLAGGGSPIAITDADLDIAIAGFGAALWSSKGVRVDVDSSRATGHWKRGLDVDTWNVTLAPRAVDPVTQEQFPDKIGSVPWVQAAYEGALDGSTWFVDRAYFASWPQPWTQAVTPVGVIRMFVGQPANITAGDITVAVVLNDLRQKLRTQLPLGVFQAGCRHTLFDVGCTLLASSFGVNGTILSSTGAQVASLPISAPGGSGTYTLGRLAMTSGLNAGVSRTITQWSGTLFDLLKPFPFTVSAGDTFTAYPGCDKQKSTCTAFANLANYGGEPNIPAVETAV